MLIKKVRNRLYSIYIKGLFGEMGASVVEPPIKLWNPQKISIGNDSRIFGDSWLQVLDSAENTDKGPPFRIEIGDHCYIGHRCHIVALKKVRLGNGVMFADNVFVTDADHEYRDVTKPAQDQPVRMGEPVAIEDGAWLGQNVVVLPGTHIGKNAVIGANSTVKGEVPPYSVAAGSPARVIKLFDVEKGEWVKLAAKRGDN
jgi:acetyltransferase-like isoleucine patch superfamily enzyme